MKSFCIFLFIVACAISATLTAPVAEPSEGQTSTSQIDALLSVDAGDQHEDETNRPARHYGFGQGYGGYGGWGGYGGYGGWGGYGGYGGYGGWGGYGGYYPRYGYRHHRHYWG